MRKKRSKPKKMPNYAKVVGEHINDLAFRKAAESMQGPLAKTFSAEFLAAFYPFRPASGLSDRQRAAVQRRKRKLAIQKLQALPDELKVLLSLVLLP